MNSVNVASLFSFFFLKNRRIRKTNEENLSPSEDKKKRNYLVQYLNQFGQTCTGNLGKNKVKDCDDAAIKHCMVDSTASSIDHLSYSDDYHLPLMCDPLMLLCDSLLVGPRWKMCIYWFSFCLLFNLLSWGEWCSNKLETISGILKVRSSKIRIRNCCSFQRAFDSMTNT